jgi:energy-coupling factor transporter ATP-binding protein EcfA2
MNDAPGFPAENPFCTRRIKPGALPYLFPPKANLESMVKQLKDTAGWGEIVGPHGSGKSTLLASLIPALHAAGWRTQLIELHDGERRLPVNLREIPETDIPFMLLVDGYEQLGSLSRFHLKRNCRRRGWGLIVTSHRPAGLPELFDTAVSPESANRIVQELLKQSDYSISPEEIADRFARHEGNLRELLFELYDLFEQSR